VSAVFGLCTASLRLLQNPAGKVPFLGGFTDASEPSDGIEDRELS
jgi:hypothetical protein